MNTSFLLFIFIIVPLGYFGGYYHFVEVIIFRAVVICWFTHQIKVKLDSLNPHALYTTIIFPPGVQFYCGCWRNESAFPFFYMSGEGLTTASEFTFYNKLFLWWPCNKNPPQKENRLRLYYGNFTALQMKLGRMEYLDVQLVLCFLLFLLQILSLLYNNAREVVAQQHGTVIVN